MSTSEIAPVCPHCGQLDAVRKASAIYRDGISVSEYETYATGQLGDKVVSWPVKKEQVSVSALAQKLEPPSKQLPGHFSGIGMIIGSVLGFGLPLAIGVAVSRLNPEFDLSCILPLLLLGGLVAGAAIGFAVGNDMDQKSEDYKRALRAWERAMERWHSLYYCFRCDRVFIPGQNRSVPVASMQSLLYE